MLDKGQIHHSIKDKQNDISRQNDLIVLDSSIFSNVFKKDIKRVYLYKKTERLAKALHLILPAFHNSRVLQDRFEVLSIALIDASIHAPNVLREMLSRELLSLSSLLAVARTAKVLSIMNVDIIQKEVHDLLSEIASYEEPFVHLDRTASLAELLAESEKKQVAEGKDGRASVVSPLSLGPTPRTRKKESLGDFTQRQEQILSIIKDKKEVYIKDISTLLLGVSEKTIQRELASLVLANVLEKKGDKRWTTYTLK